MGADDDEQCLDIDPGSGSWRQEQDKVDPTTSASIAASVVSGSDDARDIEEGIIWAPQQQSSTSTPRSAVSRSVLRASRPTVVECLNDVPKEELADLSLDVYNMFFLSDVGSQSFFYSIVIFIVKVSLYALVLADLAHNKKFPVDERAQVSNIVRAAQLFLMPVAILMQEELITSFFIVSHLKYSPSIRRRHPGAYMWKFVVAHSARFVDGCIFLFINICVMLLQVNDVLGIFLNFAALMFLQTIDNIALQVCLDGYWTRSLQDDAKDVVDMKFAYRHHCVHYCMQTSFVVVVWLAFLGFWIGVQVNASS